MKQTEARAEKAKGRIVKTRLRHNLSRKGNDNNSLRTFKKQLFNQGQILSVLFVEYVSIESQLLCHWK